jgi:hypothetical protein
MEDRRRRRGAAPREREEDPTLALLRQQQETMVRMMEQQQRTNAVIELLAARLVQGPDAGGPLPVAPPVVRPPPPPPAPEPPVQPPPVQPPPVQPPPVHPPPVQPPPVHPPPARDEMSEWRRVALAMAASFVSCVKAPPHFCQLRDGKPGALPGGVRGLLGRGTPASGEEAAGDCRLPQTVSGQMGEVPQG